MDKKRIVVKVGTSTLTYENGKINLRRVDKLCKVRFKKLRTRCRACVIGRYRRRRW